MVHMMVQKRMKYERNVVSHIEKVHFGKDECVCNICEAKLTRKYNLKTHLAEQHGVVNYGLALNRESLKLYTCTVCDKKFHRRYHLTDHQQVHNEKKDLYICDICHETFTHKRNLTRHEKTQHGKGSDIECSVCDRRFQSYWNFNEHFKTHSVSKETFNCSLCEKQFLSRWNLKRHVILKHEMMLIVATLFCLKFQTPRTTFENPPLCLSKYSIVEGPGERRVPANSFS